MKNIVELINTNSDWLYIKILENPIFFIDFWSFAHLWSGGVLFALFSAAKLKYRWGILILFLVLYEVIEITIIFLALNVFRPETIKDQATDILVGICGGLLVYWWLKFYSSPRNSALKRLLNPNTHIALFTALTISFLWVGFYRYEYNVPILNSKGLNYTAASLWTANIFSIIVFYSWSSIKIKKAYSIGLMWPFYFFGLCIFEYSFYHLCGIKESGAHEHKPLIFDIIHGTTVLHIYYLTIPFISIALYSMFQKLFNTACRRIAEFKEPAWVKKKQHVLKVNEAS